jgi:hypothetical protein
MMEQQQQSNIEKPNNRIMEIMASIRFVRTSFLIFAKQKKLLIYRQFDMLYTLSGSKTTFG